MTYTPKSKRNQKLEKDEDKIVRNVVGLQWFLKRKILELTKANEKTEVLKGIDSVSSNEGIQWAHNPEALQPSFDVTRESLTIWFANPVTITRHFTQWDTAWIHR